jgi:alcohol dehydrogenase, propanol-preferring
MKAMRLERIALLSPGTDALSSQEVPIPAPAAGEILIRVSVCGVCHTELDEIEGRTPPPRLPVILGHQVVGQVVDQGKGAHAFSIGARVGVAWIYSACGECGYCRSGQENLCREFKASGRDADGGYAEYMKVPEAFAHAIPAEIPDIEAAPLLCAGAVGYRSLRLADLQDGQALGLTGFGASGHLVLKLARYLYPASPILVFARSQGEQAFAREIGATWAGDTQDKPPMELDAVIDTTPVWLPVIKALEMLRPGGRLVINAIRKENNDLHVWQGLDYGLHLWQEKEIKSVANVTRQDVREFLDLAALIPIHPEIQEYPLEQANLALQELKERKIRGAKVLRIQGE